jgi:hypothetical protein
MLDGPGIDDIALNVPKALRRAREEDRRAGPGAPATVRSRLLLFALVVLLVVGGAVAIAALLADVGP